MSFYAGSAGSVVVPAAAAGSAYGVPVTHTVAAAPPPVQIIHTQAPAMHYAPAPMTAAYPVYAQPRVAAPYPAVPLTANPLMYQAPGYGYPYYPRGPPTVIVSSSRKHRRHSSRGFLGYL